MIRLQDLPARSGIDEQDIVGERGKCEVVQMRGGKGPISSTASRGALVVFFCHETVQQSFSLWLKTMNERRGGPFPKTVLIILSRKSEAEE